jgi:hypothetical protein
MAISEQVHQLDPRLLKDLKELRDTREEALRALGREEGREEGLRVALETLARTLFPRLKEKDLAPLHELSAETLQEMLVETINISDVRAFKNLLRQKSSSSGVQGVEKIKE